MKILMCNSFYYMRGGAERYVFELTALFEKHGHEVIPFAMNHEKNVPSRYSNYFVSKIDYPSLLKQKTSALTRVKVVERLLYSREAKQKITRLIKDTRPDIAHVHGVGHELSPSVLDALKSFNIPVVQTLHDYGLVCPNSSFLSRGAICERCKKQRYYNVVLQRCKRNSVRASLLACLEKYYHAMLNIYEKDIDIFIAPGKFIQRKLKEHGIKKEIVHIPNFVNIDGFQPNYSSSDYYVFLGRLSKEKGLSTLIHAAEYNRSAKLFIAGEGELRDELQQCIAEKQLEHVILLGHLATPELIKLVSGAAFTVIPSEWYENYPMSLIESFACGKPVIASNLGAMPDLIRDGWNGLLFEPKNRIQLADKIRYLLAHPDEAVEMGKHARAEVEITNSPEKHYQSILQVYQRAKDICSFPK